MPYTAAVAPTNDIVFTQLTLTASPLTASSITIKTGWCGQAPFTSPSTTQAQSTFTYTAGRPVTFSITQFTATYQCGSNPLPVFAYSGTLSNNSPLPAFISIHPTNGAISVTSPGTVGPTSIIVTGFITNVGPISASFTLNGLPNHPPAFNSPLFD